MAGARSKAGARDGSVADLTRWRQALPAVSICVGVLGVLLLAAVLQTGDGEPEWTLSPLETSGPPQEPIAAALSPPASEIPATPTTPLPSTGQLLDLARRVELDQAKLAATPSGWTLQFMLACDPANVRSRVARLNTDNDFFLLSKLHGERACFRLCWGLFDSKEQAAASRGFPAALASITDRPQPLPVEQALQ